MNAEFEKPASRLPRRHSAWYFRGYKFAPDVVFDIGVFDGTPWLYRSFPKARFVLIDPQAECEQRVTGKLESFDFHAVALGEAEGMTTLNVPETKPGRGGAMASILPRADRAKGRFSSIEHRKVPVKRLDDLASSYHGRVGLKIDTEGFEAQVLAGGPETLKRADFVIVELSVLPRFEGVAPPSQVVATLANAGLELRDVLSAATYSGKRPRPHCMDMLFARWPA